VFELWGWVLQVKVWVIEGSGKEESKAVRWFEAVPGEDGAPTQQEAEHIMAAKALFGIDPKQPLYRVMPPVFKDRWLGWEAQAKEAVTTEKEEMKGKEEAHFAAILAAHEAAPTAHGSRERETARPREGGRKRYKKPKTAADFAAAAPRANPRESEALRQQASPCDLPLHRYPLHCLTLPCTAVREHV
jgi:hypothetical protein